MTELANALGSALEAAAIPAPAGDFSPPSAAATPAPAPTATHMSYKHKAIDTPYTVDISAVPSDLRMVLLQKQIASVIGNRVTTAEAATKKVNEVFEQYAAAIAADPLQSVIAKPEGEPKVTDYAGIISGAIADLYAGTAGRRVEGTGERKSREVKDPLIAQITRAVVSDVHKKNKAANPSYKWTEAAKEVGADGLAYLKGKIEEQIAAGTDRKAMEDFLENRYVKPARVMLGLDTPGKLKDAVGIL